jgi:hypothetical protein
LNNKVLQFAARLGCLTSIVAPLLALILYPRVIWLFAFLLLGVAILALMSRHAPDPTPLNIADRIERLLNGNGRDWDVDDFENLCPHDPQLKELWMKAMYASNLPPGKWPRMSAEEKLKMQEIIQTLKALDEERNHSAALKESLSERGDEPPQKRDLS